MTSFERSVSGAFYSDTHRRRKGSSKLPGYEPELELAAYQHKHLVVVSYHIQ